MRANGFLNYISFLKINIKNVTFLLLILDYQFKNLVSRLYNIKKRDKKCDMKIIENLRFQIYLSIFMIRI